jgi:hypothetical protein
MIVMDYTLIHHRHLHLLDQNLHHHLLQLQGPHRKVNLVNLKVREQ